MGDKIASIAASALVVAGMTTLVLPGRQTPAVAREGGTAIAKIVNALIGRG
jgi:hypothetical protein